MNELLQKHGCSNVFNVPEGLRELMADISREVLRSQPANICDFIANYLSILIITREHGIMAVKILDDLCDCRPSVSEHLIQIGMERSQAEALSQVIKEEIEGFEPVEGKEKVKETQILKKILTRTVLDEDLSAKVCQVVRNAYRDYWYRKKTMEQTLKDMPDEPWEIAAQRTLELYKRTKPSFNELTRATEKIQAAYRGYHVRRNILRHLKPKPKRKGPKVELPGPPLDIAASREIDLGPVLDLKVREDDVGVMFDEDTGEKLGLKYDPMKTITHVEDTEVLFEDQVGKSPRTSRALSKALKSAKSIVSPAVSIKSHLDTKAEDGGTRTVKLPSVMIDDPKYRRSSQVSEGARSQKRISSQDLHKISFAQVPPQIIPHPEDEVHEDIEVPETDEVPETAETPEIAGAPETAEVPEDLPDLSEADGDSAPSVSVPSSAPETDVEDTTVAGGETTEEEGE